jgi:hypothetical protein
VRKVRFHVGPQDRIHPRQIAFALFPEPRQYILIDAQTHQIFANAIPGEKC